jgi:thiamine biosynthesis lipoprotein
LISPDSKQPLERFEFQEPQMGMPFRIVLYAPNKGIAVKAAETAFARVSQLNGIMSDYEAESELSLLSSTAGSGQAVRLSPDLWRVLARAQEFSRHSGGAFDITVGPCVSLWRRARREGKLPNPERLAEARAAVGYRKLELDYRRKTARLRSPHMRLDLGGIAKGYALQEAARVLDELGVHRMLVAGSGDIVVGDAPPGKAGWRIEVAPLDVTNAPLPRYVSLTRAALCTSGDLFQRVEIDGKRYSHVLDPRTGIGLTDHSLVTVIARDGTTADALTKVVSVLGPNEGFRLVEAEGAHAFAVRKPRDRLETYETRGFHKYLEPARDGAAGKGN